MFGFGAENEVMGAERGMFSEELVVNPFIKAGNSPAGPGIGPPKCGGISPLWNDGIRVGALISLAIICSGGMSVGSPVCIRMCC